MSEERPKGGRRGRAMRKRAREAALQDVGKVIRSGVEVELYRPLTTREIERIHEAALTVLERVGMGDGIPILYELAAERGCEITEEGRVKFPRALVEDVLAGACRSFVFHGRASEHDMQIAGTRVHFGTAGAAVSVPDFETGRYRASTLHDIYDFGRLVDRLPNLSWYSRTVVPAEIEDWTAMDINMAYATAASTMKPIGVSFNDAGNVAPVIEMFDVMLGGEGRFAERPFCKVHSTAIVPPLKFAPENSEVNVAAARNGMPVNLIIAAQAGATSPASLAGTLVQTTAEALGGLVLINLVRPGHPVIFSNWPFTSDLRTGAFSGGGPEEALLNAGAAQIANWYGLPSGVAAGMTDSKVPDNQAGYEKAITNLLVGMSGPNFVYESAGMQGALLACSYEALAIDNEMMGNILRVLRGIEVSEDTLSVPVIEEAVAGPGHFLGHEQTLGLMQTEYLFPELGRSKHAGSVGRGRESGHLPARARTGARDPLHPLSPDHSARCRRADQGALRHPPARGGHAPGMRALVIAGQLVLPTSAGLSSRWRRSWPYLRGALAPGSA